MSRSGHGVAERAAAVEQLEDALLAREPADVEDVVAAVRRRLGAERRVEPEAQRERRVAAGVGPRVAGGHDRVGGA